MWSISNLMADGEASNGICSAMYLLLALSIMSLRFHDAVWAYIIIIVFLTPFFKGNITFKTLSNKSIIDFKKI